MKIVDKLNPREKRTVLFCLIGGALIFVYVFIVEPIIQGGQEVRSQLQRDRAGLYALLAKEGSSEALKRKNLVTMVPAMEMPVSAEKQNQLLRDKITQQLQQSGVQVKNFQFSTGTAQGPGASGMTTLQCRGKCQFSALWKFLDELKKNPYYVGIEELSIKVDEKNRQQLEIAFTVSTFQGSGA